MPSKSVAKPLIVTPASIAGLVDCNWKLGSVRERLVKWGFAPIESEIAPLAGRAPFP
jgi:hypothetical protein